MKKGEFDKSNSCKKRTPSYEKLKPFSLFIYLKGGLDKSSPYIRQAPTKKQTTTN